MAIKTKKGLRKDKETDSKSQYPEPFFISLPIKTKKSNPSSRRLSCSLCFKIEWGTWVNSTFTCYKCWQKLEEKCYKGQKSKKPTKISKEYLKIHQGCHLKHWSMNCEGCLMDAELWAEEQGWHSKKDCPTRL